MQSDQKALKQWPVSLWHHTIAAVLSALIVSTADTLIWLALALFGWQSKALGTKFFAFSAAAKWVGQFIIDLRVRLQK